MVSIGYVLFALCEYKYYSNTLLKYDVKPFNIIMS